VPAAIGQADFLQAAPTVIAVVGGVAFWICLLGDIALIVALIFPDCFTANNLTYEPTAVLVAGWFVFWRYDCDQVP